MFRHFDNPEPVPSPAPRAKLWLFLRRAMRLRCPECGVSPVFIPWNKVRGIDDWLRPLDGCPRCGYAYEREQGYWLIAIWVINYGVVGSLGLAAALLALDRYDLPISQAILIVAIPMPILSLLFARHAKSLYLAIDHWFDPHLK
jgi:uncharacterized protein (DUF983 family)